MDGSTVIQWLLEDDNPAVKYRTQTEILCQTAGKEAVITWLKAFLPLDWTERRGLWFIYYITAFAECGLSYTDIPLDKKAIVGSGDNHPFECGCADFMHLRALVRLGLGNEPAVKKIIGQLSEQQFPDGGFLCLHRIKKLERIPKSCVKANMHTLMFCAECKKKGIQTNIEKPLLDYFWNHKLFYRTDNPETLILNAREGWRTIDTFYPFEVMRVGLQNIIESLCALGYGNDGRLDQAWSLLEEKKDPLGKMILNGTLSKSYLPKAKERCGKPSKWATFYTLLALKEKGSGSYREGSKPLKSGK